MKFILSILLVSIAYLANSQGLSNVDKKDKVLFLEGNIGTRVGYMDVTEGYTMNSSGLNLSGSMGFMFNRVIGVRGALGYDGVFAQNDSTKKHSNTDIFRITIGGIVSISEWANFSTKRFNLNFHFGVGWSTMSNRQFKKDNPTYDDGKLIAKNDDLGHVIVGITPHIHINDRISFTSDFSFLMLTSYHYNVDYQQSRDIRGWDNYMNLSVGILFRLKTWAPTVGNRPSN